MAGSRKANAQTDPDLPSKEVGEMLRKTKKEDELAPGLEAEHNIFVSEDEGEQRSQSQSFCPRPWWKLALAGPRPKR